MAATAFALGAGFTETATLEGLATGADFLEGAGLAAVALGLTLTLAGAALVDFAAGLDAATDAPLGAFFGRGSTLDFFASFFCDLAIGPITPELVFSHNLVRHRACGSFMFPVP